MLEEHLGAKLCLSTQLIQLRQRSVFPSITFWLYPGLSERKRMSSAGPGQPWSLLGRAVRLLTVIKHKGNLYFGALPVRKRYKAGDLHRCSLLSVKEASTPKLWHPVSYQGAGNFYLQRPRD